MRTGNDCAALRFALFFVRRTVGVGGKSRKAKKVKTEFIREMGHENYAATKKKEGEKRRREWWLRVLMTRGCLILFCGQEENEEVVG